MSKFEMGPHPEVNSMDEKTKSWEVVGYVLPIIKAPVLVRPVLREATNPKKWFFAKDPNTDVLTKVESMPKKDNQGRPFLGAPVFVKLDTPVKYYLYSVCILLENGNLVQSWASEEVADFVENNYLKVSS